MGGAEEAEQCGPGVWDEGRWQSIVVCEAGGGGGSLIHTAICTA